MTSKKLVLSLGSVLFGLIYCTNAELGVQDSKLRVAQDECVQVLDNKQSHDEGIDSVPFCKIHHGDSTELENLNLVDILREVWKDDGFDCDKVLNGIDKIKSCECTVIIESCECRILDMCEEHRMRLEGVVKARLDLVNKAIENKQGKKISNVDDMGIIDVDWLRDVRLEDIGYWDN